MGDTFALFHCKFLHSSQAAAQRGDAIKWYEVNKKAKDLLCAKSLGPGHMQHHMKARHAAAESIQRIERGRQARRAFLRHAARMKLMAAKARRQQNDNCSPILDCCNKRAQPSTQNDSVLCVTKVSSV